MIRTWPIALLAACGGSGDKPDPPADAASSMGSVTVIVTERGKPVQGVPVFFTSTDGATQFSAVTSLEGACGYSIESGFVTVQFPRPRYGIDRFTTFAGLASGNTVHLDLEPPGPQAYEVDVTIPADPAGPTRPHLLYTSCLAEEPWGLVPGAKTKIALQCADARIDMLVVSVDPDTNEPRGSLFVPNVDISSGVANVTGSVGNFTAVTSVAVTYPNLAPYTFASTTHLTLTARGRTYEAFANSGEPAAQPPVPAQPLFRVTATGADQLVASTAYPLLTDFDEQVIYDLPGTAAGDITIDMGRRLPGYVNEELDTKKPPIIGRFNIATNQLEWKQKTPGTMMASFARARVRFTREPIPLQGTSWIWEIVSPRASSLAIQFPKIGAPGEAFNPVAGDIATVEELTNVLLPGGQTYANVRDHAFDDINTLIPRSAGPTIVQRRFISPAEPMDPEQ
jgi:hypothetical protein